MQDQRNYGKYEQQVDEPARDMKNGEPAKPSDQQDHKQYCPDAHSASYVWVSRRIKLCVSFSRSPGCTLRLFPGGALADPFAEVRNLVGDVGSRLVTAGRCH
jgi:hypothetical protein